MHPLVVAHGGGCWECGIATSIILLAMFLVVLAIPVGLVWLLIKGLRPKGKS
jgi:hypothetical protein